MPSACRKASRYRMTMRIRRTAVKVSNMKTVALSIPCSYPSTGAINARINPVIVRLTADEGLEGFGICFSNNDRQVKSLKACLDDLEEIVLGQDVFRFAEAWQKLWAATNRMGHQGYPIYALAAIDSALWMLRAKALNLPLATLLGGFREKVPVYASHYLWRYCTIDQLQKDAASLVKQGFRMMKMRMGSYPLPVELERYQAVREAVGKDIDIMIDLNWHYTVSEAIRIGRELDKRHAYWFEDPLASDDPEQIAQVAAALDMPVVVGETYCNKYGFRTLLEKKATDIVMIDLQKVGGVTEWMRVANMAEAWNLPVASHLFPDFSLHLVAAIPNGLVMEYLPWWDMIYQEPYAVKEGFIEVPKTPGIGLELDLAVLRKYELK